MESVVFTKSEYSGFTKVWEQLLILKVNVIYKISIEKNEDFLKLLEEFLPEALEKKYLWEENFIIENKA